MMRIVVGLVDTSGVHHAHEERQVGCILHVLIVRDLSIRLVVGADGVIV